MNLTDLLLAELDREAPLCRRALERIPDGHSAWKPHERSMAMGQLATLVATMPGWIDLMVNQDSLDIAPAGGSSANRPPDPRTKTELLQALDDAVARGRAALRGTTDEHLMTTWRLLAGGRPMSERPRHIAIQEGVFNHLAHHRGQLTVYLRLTGASVPSIYGPSGDEPAG